MIRLKLLEIENFRSIEYLQLHPTQLWALVGANSAGKSNVLSALELLHGKSYPTENSLNENHYFYRDRSRPIRIKTVFEESLDDGGLRERVFEFRQEPGDERYRLFVNGAWARGDIRETFPVVRIGVDRSIRSNRPTNRWTLLGRMLLDINLRFKEDAALVHEFETTMSTLKNDVLGAVPEFRGLMEALEREARSQLGPGIDELGAELSLHDPWDFYRTLTIIVNEHGLRLPAEESGMGVQSSIVIALLRAYASIAKSSRAVIAIEEPELFLHPLAKRHFYRELREIAMPSSGEPGIQVIYTTHATEMLDLEYFDEVCRLSREDTDARDGARATVARQVSVRSVLAELSQMEGGVDATETSLRKRMHRYSTAGYAVALFSRVAVLVEGDTEAEALPIWLRRCGLDVESSNVAIVNAGGKNALRPVERVLARLGIACLVIADGDAHAPTRAQPEINRWLCARAGQPVVDYPASFVANRTAVWNEDIEHELRATCSDYAHHEQQAREELGVHAKPLIARAAAESYCANHEAPVLLQSMAVEIAALLGQSAPDASVATYVADGDDIPF